MLHGLSLLTDAGRCNATGIVHIPDSALDLSPLVLEVVC